MLFLIPLRRYFVREMHGQLPYPEATAITEVLVTGEKGGSQAKLLLQATAISAVYDFFVTTFQVWREFVDFQFIPVMKTLAEKTRIVVRFDAVGLHPRARIRDGAALVDDPVRRRRGREFRARAAGVHDRQPFPARRSTRARFPSGEMDARRSSAAMCDTSASAPLPRPASSASSNR